MKCSLIRNVALLLFLTVAFVAGTWAADVGNCLMCHKYPGLSRVTENGTLRLCYVNEDIFNSSVHSKVKCQGCHTDVDKIPHDPAKKVDCLTQCHIVEPTTEKKFSHEHAAHFLSQSVHSKYDQNGKLTGVIYMVDNTVFVTLRDISKVGDVIGAAVDAGANSINSIQFDAGDRRKQAPDD